MLVDLNCCCCSYVVQRTPTEAWRSVRCRYDQHLHLLYCVQCHRHVFRDPPPLPQRQEGVWELVLQTRRCVPVRHEWVAGRPLQEKELLLVPSPWDCSLGVLRLYCVLLHRLRSEGGGMQRPIVSLHINEHNWPVSLHVHKCKSMLLHVHKYKLMLVFKNCSQFSGNSKKLSLLFYW